jgi:hypothetical protein
MPKPKMHRVQLMLDGKLEGDGYQDVQAATEKEAAEKLHGGVLFKQGPHSRIRALVLSSPGSDTPTLFYER